MRMHSPAGTREPFPGRDAARIRGTRCIPQVQAGGRQLRGVGEGKVNCWSGGSGIASIRLATFWVLSLRVTSRGPAARRIRRGRAIGACCCFPSLLCVSGGIYGWVAVSSCKRSFISGIWMCRCDDAMLMLVDAVGFEPHKAVRAGTCEVQLADTSGSGCSARRTTVRWVPSSGGREEPLVVRGLRRRRTVPSLPDDEKDPPGTRQASAPQGRRWPEAKWSGHP